MKIDISQALSLDRGNAHFPIDKEARITTLDKSITIESAYPGWQRGS